MRQWVAFQLIWFNVRQGGVLFFITRVPGGALGFFYFNATETLPEGSRKQFLYDFCFLETTLHLCLESNENFFGTFWPTLIIKIDF